MIHAFITLDYNSFSFVHRLKSRMYCPSQAREYELSLYEVCSSGVSAMRAPVMSYCLMLLATVAVISGGSISRSLYVPVVLNLSSAYQASYTRPWCFVMLLYLIYRRQILLMMGCAMRTTLPAL